MRMGPPQHFLSERTNKEHVRLGWTALVKHDLIPFRMAVHGIDAADTDRILEKPAMHSYSAWSSGVLRGNVPYTVSEIS